MYTLLYNSFDSNTQSLSRRVLTVKQVRFTLNVPHMRHGLQDGRRARSGQNCTELEGSWPKPNPALPVQTAGERWMTTWRLVALPCGAWTTAWSVQPRVVEVRCVGS